MPTSEKLRTVLYSKLTLKQMEQYHIMDVYESTGRDKAQAAKLLDITRDALRAKLRSYGYKEKVRLFKW